MKKLERRSIVCSKSSLYKKVKKNHEKKKKKRERSKVNLIVSHINQTFLTLDPKPLDTLIV
jgi:hypothetical protein